jgi:hypothetical protein
MRGKVLRLEKSPFSECINNCRTDAPGRQGHDASHLYTSRPDIMEAKKTNNYFLLSGSGMTGLFHLAMTIL